MKQDHTHWTEDTAASQLMRDNAAAAAAAAGCSLLSDVVDTRYCIYAPVCIQAAMIAGAFSSCKQQLQRSAHFVSETVAVVVILF